MSITVKEKEHWKERIRTKLEEVVDAWLSGSTVKLRNRWQNVAELVNNELWDVVGVLADNLEDCVERLADEMTQLQKETLPERSPEKDAQ